MDRTEKKRTLKRIASTACVGLSFAALFASSVMAPVAQVSQASSHREAPLISNDAQADGTDTYAFVSPDRPDSVTLIGSFIPLESPEGGPNYYKFGDDVVYDLNVDPIGDAIDHVKYRFEFSSQTTNPNTFLYNTGPITSVNPPSASWNIRQYFTVTEIITKAGVMTSSVLFGNKLVPPVNIGMKSTPNFEALSDQGIYSTGSGANEIKVFAGQSDDPFWVDLGGVFDLLTLRTQKAPIGYANVGPTVGLDGVAGYNVHSIAIQVPVTRVLQYSTVPTETVIGVWATSSRYSQRVLGALGSVTNSGNLVQVSRLGMPLVNEAVIPLALKDAFNSIPPSVDFPLATSAIPGLESQGALLLSSVLTPELQTLLNGLYGVPNPGKPRSDIFDIFLQGMVTAQPFTITTGGVGGTATPVTLPAGFNVNRPSAGTRQPAEMIRLNTAIKGGLCSPTPQRLGILAGDACGFPNGRRLYDDVTEIELLAVAGAAWQPLTNDTSFNFNPSLISVLTDGIDRNDKPFRANFPYLAYAQSGQDHIHPYINWIRMPLNFR